MKTAQYDEYPLAATAQTLTQTWPTSNPDPRYYGSWPTYQLTANYAGGSSTPSAASLFDPTTTVAAQVLRGPTGTTLLTIMSPLASTTTALRLNRFYQDQNFAWVRATFDLPVSQITNGIAILPEAWSVGHLSPRWYVQAIGSNASLSDPYFAGTGAIPFYDGRTQLKQNLDFPLRIPVAGDSFNYFENDDVHLRTTPRGYVQSSFFMAYSDDDCSDKNALSEFLPFENNYFYRNFVLSETELDNDGRTTTGVTDDEFVELDCLSDPVWAPVVEFPVSYAFSTPTNVTSIAGLLAPNTSRWLYYIPTFYHADLPFININEAGGRYYMTNSTRNYFGLQYLSAQFARSPSDITTLAAGSSIPINYGYVYPEPDYPVLQTTNYYFAQAGIHPLPGNSTFTETNETPTLMVGLGQRAIIAGYAKQQLMNGYANTFAFLGQYFENAFKTTNGIVMTNQTGVLSPYGEFFPTESGRMALTTMPDLDTGARGTATVYCVKLELDVNHDGTIDRTLNGQDNTSATHPFVFWLNNDNDGLGGGEGDEITTFVEADNTNNEIGSKRDLEDFARLWISGIPPLPSGQGWTVQLTFLSAVRQFGFFRRQMRMAASAI